MPRLLPASERERILALAAAGLLAALFLGTGISNATGEVSWTLVDSNGTVHSDWSSGDAVSSSRLGEGRYEVVLPEGVRACSQQVTVGGPRATGGAPEAGGSAWVQDADPGEGRLTLQTYDSAGLPADRSFGIAVLCDP
jgi:hypothetical protein